MINIITNKDKDKIELTVEGNIIDILTEISTAVAAIADKVSPRSITKEEAINKISDAAKYYLNNPHTKMEDIFFKIISKN